MIDEKKIQVRMPATLHTRIKTLQEDQTIEMSMNRLILILLDEALDAEEKPVPGAVSQGS